MNYRITARPHYSATKGAVLAFSRAPTAELARRDAFEFKPTIGMPTEPRHVQCSQAPPIVATTAVMITR